MESKIYSIKEITDYIKNIFSRDQVLSDLWLSGEISNFYHHNSGHMYFTLKDSSSCIKTIMFKGNNQKLKFEPEEGMQVTAHGYVSVYAPKGDYQFYIDKLQPEGEGALFLAFKQLKQKLEDEGLFEVEKKQSIPLLPQKIGIVTSPTGAAIRDILSVVRRRFKNVSILIVPSLVQGEQAADQIVSGISYLNKRDDIDLIIVSRGGGSLEDLWPFNEERVARTVYNSEIPIISGVGHETDFTITDFVADLRAPTPSAAAEQAIANRVELEKNLKNLNQRLLYSIQNQINNCREKLNFFSKKRIFTNPDDLFSKQIQLLDELNQKLELNMEKIINNCKQKFEILSSKLDTLSPLKTLKRGYSITSDSEGKAVQDLKQVEIGDNIITKIAEGKIYSTIDDLKTKLKSDGDKNE